MKNRLAAISRISCAVALLAALCGLGACGGHDVGPERPWNLFADESPQRSR